MARKKKAVDLNECVDKYEAARRLRVSQSTLGRMQQEGILQPYLHRGRRMFPVEQIEDYLVNLPVVGGAS